MDTYKENSRESTRNPFYYPLERITVEGLDAIQRHDVDGTPISGDALAIEYGRA